MEKEIRRIVYLFAAFILCVIWLTAHYTGRYYENVLGIPPTDVIRSRMNG